MNIQKIKDELAANSITYGSMTDAEVVAYMETNNAPIITKESLSGHELFGVTVESEYNSLTAEKKQEWLGLCGIDVISKAATPLIKSIFPNTTDTWAAIVALGRETKTIAEVLGNPNEGDIRKARNS